MGLLKSTRLAWSIAIASLALWAASAPLSAGQVATSADRLLQGALADDATSQSGTNTLVNLTTTTSTTSDDSTLVSGMPCPALPGAMTEPLPPVPAAAPASASNLSEGTFQLCGPDDVIARKIEQLIAGRSFSASLSATGSGCASLTLRATSDAVTTGRAASTLNVSLGSGQRLSLQIVSEGGATRVNIGQAS